jgi:hypothetical protein
MDLSGKAQAQGKPRASVAFLIPRPSALNSDGFDGERQAMAGDAGASRAPSS